MKKEIKEMKDPMPWPPQPNYPASDKILIPQTLRVFQEILMNT